MIRADVLGNSVGPDGPPLLTFKLRYPKFIHGECKTHRLLRLGDEGGYELAQEIGLMDDPRLSRNASSSRAIPTRKYIEEVRSDWRRAAPAFWGAEQKGMSPGGELVGKDLLRAQDAWKEAAFEAAARAEVMLGLGVHKSIINRILDPFIHINVIVTATEWDNFFGLRLDASADPTMRALAEAMWQAKAASVPRRLEPGQWHLPLVTEDDERAALQEAADTGWPEDLLTDRATELCRYVSVARCARVSYESFETGRRSTMAEDVALHDRLVGSQPMHASPAEHQATPDRRIGEITTLQIGAGEPREIARGDYWANPTLHGNLLGWIQYRKTLVGEDLAPLPEGYAS